MRPNRLSPIYIEHSMNTVNATIGFSENLFLVLNVTALLENLLYILQKRIIIIDNLRISLSPFFGKSCRSI